ncbi:MULTISPECIES: transporter substrate-binding domain-containing protein [unclassified Bradyrhizobium]|uniref:transporter substrate-binding domain-containing protein n=1 Tax=unclassified Bradyrhizobium TaxID=2631580 RepID=UPI00201373A2|nr:MULTISPECIES: transporter substrate-binding domain-containing protein [unclassified Bradyrhizobium]
MSFLWVFLQGFAFRFFFCTDVQIIRSSQQITEWRWETRRRSVDWALESGMAGRRQIIVAILMVAAALCRGSAVAADPEVKQILAPSGTLKVALYTGTPTSILPDPKAGGPKGVGYDLGKELATRLGVPFEPVVFSRNAEVLEAVKTSKADIALTNATAARAREMDFGPPVFEVELGYLVPKGSALTALTEVDAAGIRVGVTAGSSSDATLSRDLKKAEIVRAANFDAAIEMLTAGTLHAYATNKASLYEMSEKLPGSKVLDGRWGVERFAIGVPKGRDGGMAFIRQFTEAAKSEGLVKAAIVRAGLRGAVTPETQN